MPNAAIVAAALTTPDARAWGLYLDGVDVIKQPGNVSNPVGVAISTVEVDKAGPGGVSSMTFTIDDPAVRVVLTDGMQVRFYDFAQTYPEFLGWVQDWSYAPAFGQQGRLIRVTCIGVEAVLDWSVTTVALTFTAATFLYDMLQAIVGASAGPIAELRAISGGSSSGNQTTPIGIMGNAQNIDLAAAPVTVTIPAGTTIREAFAIASAICVPSRPGTAGNALTVDTFFGLRAWEDKPNTYPDDWSGLVIPATIKAEDPEHTVDAAGIIRGVWVTGSNAASTGLVTDGTGKAGQISQLSNSDITTKEQRDAVGQAYLAQFAIGNRGSFDLEDWSYIVTFLPGATVTITDPTAGLSSNGFKVGSITKRFHATRQDWHVSYGGFRPSMVALTRRLTRSTRN